MLWNNAWKIISNTQNDLYSFYADKARSTLHQYIYCLNVSLSVCCCGWWNITTSMYAWKQQQPISNTLRFKTHWCVTEFPVKLILSIHSMPHVMLACSLVPVRNFLQIICFYFGMRPQWQLEHKHDWEKFMLPLTLVSLAICHVNSKYKEFWFYCVVCCLTLERIK